MKHPDYPITPILFHDVEITGGFWASRIKKHREITLSHVLKKCEKTHRIDNFALAGGLKKGGKTSKFPFDDSDVYKILEGASHILKTHKDPNLERNVDDIIEKIVAAQEDDGYLYTNRTINPNNPHLWAGKKRWELVSIFSHELYNVGHLYEAAVAHFDATRKPTLLNVAIKNANLVEKEFGYGKIENPPGHQEIEIGLVKLFRQTGEKKYLELAKFFLEIRGDKNRKGYREYVERSKNQFPWKGEDRFKYNQTHAMVSEQEEAIGHAVRALYMYSGMLDVGILTKTEKYLKINERLWQDVVYKKLYITGGVGNEPNGEAFGKAYHLPNLEAYNETCAAIGLIFWNHRLFLLHGDSKYIDVLERTLYNGFLAGYSLDGKHFFYTNPLASKGMDKRNAWYSCACCPSNITRFIPTISGYIYALMNDRLHVNLYINSKATFSISDNTILSIIQETSYPWEGKVNFKINPSHLATFDLALRIPGWAMNKPVPCDLYHYLETNTQNIIIKVNGKEIDYYIERGYAILSREWKKGDQIEVIIPMPVRRVISNEKVEINLGKVALERGPLVYCLEWPDNDFRDLNNIFLPDSNELNAEFQNDLLNGVMIIKGKINYHEKENSKKECEFIAIPYYVWAHRVMGEMIVWINRL
ncbi:MAG: glycoside hydrolase family 127 protein [Promethearchaeota archaeon]